MWTNAGGDFSGTASASAAVAGVGVYSWGSTAGTVADLQDWLDTPGNNFGWLMLGDESTTKTAKRFNSREHATLCSRPVLTVEFLSEAACYGTGDLDHNCQVNLIDYASLAGWWGAMDCCPQNNWCEGADTAPADDPDGSVGLADLVRFGAHWLE